MNDDGRLAAEIVRDYSDIDPLVAIVLGSGLGRLAEAVTDAVRIAYADLPGFPQSAVSGHRSELVIGRLEDVPVLVFSGRSHYYEQGDAAAMRPAMGLARQLGCDAVILTNSAGSTRSDMTPGDLMLITDHINYSGMNPLIGERSDGRFVGMTHTYDAALRRAMLHAAELEGLVLARGVYMWFSGPSFETPAEIRMARLLGADAIGMSTVPEAILARFFGLRVVAVSTITNLAAGLAAGELSHAETKEVAGRAGHRLGQLVRRFLRDSVQG